MARTILIYGQSGAGKTTSCRHLDPLSTFFIDADGKGLSWRGWRNDFNSDNKNFIRTSKIKPLNSADKANDSIKDIIVGISEKRPNIKVIVVDGISTLMIKDEFRRMNEKNFDKWQELAACIYGLVDTANSLRDDLTVVFIGHVQVERDEFGNTLFAHVKTSGRKLEKIVLESLFTTVLYARSEDGKYFFETQANHSTAKSPLDAFNSFYIDNDILFVINRLNDYEFNSKEVLNHE